LTAVACECDIGLLMLVVLFAAAACDFGHGGGVSLYNGFSCVSALWKRGSDLRPWMRLRQ